MSLNACLEQLSFQDAVLTYRDQWILERGFHRFKGKSLSATPFFVQRDDQLTGLVHLLSLGLRILTLSLSCVVNSRRREILWWVCILKILKRQQLNLRPRGC